MPRIRPPRFPRNKSVLARQGEALARAIQRLAPGHRDLVARIVQALDPLPAAPPETEDGAAQALPDDPPADKRH